MMKFDKRTGDLAPGVYTIPEADYLADPVPSGSLSCSGARRILDCPAKFRWERDHPVHKDVFDFGKAAHGAVLGVDGGLDVIDAPDWRKKAAQEARDESRANGRTPILEHEAIQVAEMAAAVRQHPIAGALLDPARGGQPEQTLIWPDQRAPVTLRCRIDWLPPVPATGRMIVTDYKTSVSAGPRQFARSVANYGYHQQHAFYIAGVSAVLGVDDPAFVFIVQEKDPPYLVTVCELDADAVRVGRERNRRAIDLYHECVTTGRWPSYSDEVELLSLPTWTAIQHDRDQEQQGGEDAPW